MPELPEVETVVRDLRPRLTGRTLRAVTVGKRSLRFPWRTEWTVQTVRRRIESIRRRGKWIMIDLHDGAMLLAHLGMTGQLRIVPAKEPHESHTHLVFRLDDGRELRFRDIRRFGSVRFCAGLNEAEGLIREKLGPEPWDVDPESWYRDLRGSRRALKAILLDQSVVAGVGNIYADEALFAARLSPMQRGNATSRPQAERLRLAIVAVLDRAIAARGSTIRNYVGGDGLEGGYQRELRVYGRDGRPCVTCGAVLQSTRCAGRSTHYCPRCQRPTRPRSR